MYLDDLIVIATDKATCYPQFHIIKQLFQNLGLPEATEKNQPPVKVVRWLGITINGHNMTLSILTDKLYATIHNVNIIIMAETISRKQLQSILGKL